MLQSFENHGVRFRYPQQWELQEEQSENVVTISVNSPGTSFWTVSLDFDGPDAQHVLRSAVETFHEEYNEIDGYEAEASVCHREALGHDLEFVCLDLLNTACLRVFRTGRFTALILYQATDAEWSETKSDLEAITESLSCDGDEILFGFDPA